jgi:hypothetical protein
MSITITHEWPLRCSMIKLMGFDLDAYVPDGRSMEDDSPLGRAFKTASDYVRETAGRVDGFLAIGSLDCGSSIQFVEDGLGRRCHPSEGIWTPEEVAHLANHAKWPDPDTVPEDLRWAYWSARKFVDVCVEQRHGIWFS